MICPAPRLGARAGTMTNVQADTAAFVKDVAAIQQDKK